MAGCVLKHFPIEGPQASSGSRDLPSVRCIQSLSPEWNPEFVLSKTTMLFTLTIVPLWFCVCLIVLVRESHLKVIIKIIKLKLKILT